MKRLTAGLARRFFVFWRVLLIDTFSSSPSATNQTAESCGLPSGPTVPRMAVEVAVRPIFEVPELGLTSLRLRSWDAEHHLADFMEGLLADAPLPTVLATLTRSVAASVQGLAAAVHHGWDGERFVGVAGS